MKQVVINGSIRNTCCVEQLIMDLWAENVVPDSVYDALSEYIKELREEANETTRRINTDLQAYESELSDHNTLFQDLNDNLTRILQETQEKRVKRANIADLANECLKDIANFF